SFGSLQITRGSVNIGLESIESEEIVTPVIIDTGGITVELLSIIEVVNVSNIEIFRGTAYIRPDEIISTEQFGVLQLNRNVTLSTYVNSSVINQVSIQRGVVNIYPESEIYTQSFGDFSIIRGTVNITPDSIENVAVVPDLQVTKGVINIVADSIEESFSFGLLQINRNLITSSIDNTTL